MWTGDKGAVGEEGEGRGCDSHKELPGPTEKVSMLLSHPHCSLTQKNILSPVQRYLIKSLMKWKECCTERIGLSHPDIPWCSIELLWRLKREGGFVVLKGLLPSQQPWPFPGLRVGVCMYFKEKKRDKEFHFFLSGHGSVAGTDACGGPSACLSV